MTLTRVITLRWNPLYGEPAVIQTLRQACWGEAAMDFGILGRCQIFVVREQFVEDEITVELELRAAP